MSTSSTDPLSDPLTFGRPSPAAGRPARLRGFASAPDAAYRADGGDGDRWALRAVTVAGVRHRLDGRPGEDAYAWAETAGALVVAVADGVSATPQAGRAAQVAVVAACTAAAETAAEGEEGERALPAVCAAAMSGATRAVIDGVGQVTVGATTLVVVVLGHDGRWAAARVGDSDAFVLHRDQWLSVFGDSGDEELRTGATDALPGPGVRPQSASGTLGPAQVLVLVTDGVAGPLRDGPSTVAPGLALGLREPPAPLELAHLVDFSRQGCHDDRTLLAVWPVPGPGAAD